VKHTELEDGDQLVTRTELREVLLAIHGDILEIKKEILSLRTDLQSQISNLRNQISNIRDQMSDIRETVRNKWWVPILVALIAMAANTIAVILLRH
jgi:hypothetical protein